MSDPTPPAIAVEHVTKRFGAVRALEDVTIAITTGDVHGLVGENGAGKSTLMRILSGLERPTSGRVVVRGEPVEMHGAADAQRRGVAMIHQELNLVDELSVADNIFLGRERARLGFVRGRQTIADARAHLEAIGSTVDPRARVKDLSIAQQQMVEIAKAVSQEARVLIMDEPTAVLTRHEVKLLFDLIARLKARGVTIIYISHYLDEVLSLCDRVTVLRDGRVVTTIADKAGVDERKLANLMVGREMTQQYPPRSEPAGDVRLAVEGVTVTGLVRYASFAVRRGEVFGIAGLIGAGRTELAEALVGLRRCSGTVRLDGEAVSIRSPRDAVRCGLAYLSEDRRGRGLVMGLPIADNTTLVSLPRYTAGPFVRRGAELAAAEHRRKELAIRLGDVRDRIDTLSGGNQQKVAIAKWLEVEPRVLILDEPTRGVDVGAKAEIYRLIAGLARRGMACVMISSEMNELLGMCHRIAVMRQGRLVATLDGATATEEAIMQHAAASTGARTA